MVRLQCRRLLCCWGRLGLILLVLAGCGGSSDTGSKAAVGMSRLVLHITTTDQRAGLTPRAAAPAQTRQTENSITRLRVEISGEGILAPIVVECPIPGPPTPQCQVTETPTEFIVEVEVVVPLGPTRDVAVRGFDQTGVEVFRGTTTVDLTQPVQAVPVTLSPVNVPPRANAGPDQTVAVGSIVTLRGNASSDTQGRRLTFTWVLLIRPSGSQATLVDPTSVTPTFVVDRPGTYMVQLTVNNGQTDSPPDVVTIDTVNSAPVANAGTAQTVRVRDVVTLQGNRSSDVDGDPLTFSWTFVSRPTGSQTTLVNATSVSPTFVVDRPGTYVVQLTVNDGRLTSVAATVTISTTNSAPVADAGRDQTVPRGTTVRLDGSGSSDVDGDVLTFAWSLLRVPTESQATLAGAATVNPTFVADRPGSYVVQLIVNDGTVNSASVTVTIATTNSPPVANAGPAQTVTPRTVVRLDGSASSDPDNHPLTFAWSLIKIPSSSAATLSDPRAVHPTFTVDLPGTYVAQLIVNDGLLDSAPATVTISTLNSAPVANAGPDQSVRVGATVVLDGSASSDADRDALAFAWSFTSLPTDSTTTLSNPTSVHPTFVVDKRGMYVVQLIVNDGTVNSAPDTVSITTTNAPPVANAGPDQSVNERTTVTLDGRGSSDPDGDSLAFRWTQTAGPEVMLSSSSVAQPTFTAPEVVVGTVLTFQLVVNDGTVDSTPATVSITVNAFNHPPVATGQAVMTDVNTAKIITLSGTDSDSGSLTFSVVSGPSHGSLSPLNAAVCTPSGVGATCTATITYTPAADFNGPDSFTFKVNDASLDSAVATVSITVNAFNHPPVATDDTFISPEDTPLSVGAPGVLGNDNDVDRDRLTAVLVQGPGHGQVVLQADGAFTYTPALHFNGTDTFTYRANDGIVDSNVATVTLTITASNDVPIARDDVYNTPEDTPLTVSAPGVLANDNDVEDGVTALIAVLVTSPAHGRLVLQPDGAFVYTPNLHFNGNDSLTYQARDTSGTLSNTATVTITVLPVNDAPVAVNDSYTTDEDTALMVPAPGVLANDSDVDSATLTLSVVPPLFGTLVLQPDGAFVYTPNLHFNGNDSFTYKLNDGSLDSNVAMVTITVNAVNDVPVATAQAVTTNVDTAVAITLSASDIDSPSLTFSIVSGPAHGSLGPLSPPSCTASGGGANCTATVMYSPAIHVTGPDSFTFKVNDGSLDSAPAAVSITVSTPSISLALINTTLVSVGRSATLGVTLSAPAPAGGVTVTVTSDNTGILTVTAPGTVTISLGSTTGQVTVNGIAPGTVIVRGNAPGHTEGTLNVAVVEDTVGFPFRIPGAVTVETGGTGKLTVTLARPSTVNTTVTVRNSNPAVASVPGTVTVLAGQSMASIPVTAVGEGIATVTVIIGADGLATAVFVIPPLSGALTLLADTVGGVTGGPPLAIPVGLQVSPTPLPTVVLSSGTTRTVTVPLSRPAPPGGLSVTVTLSNPAIASVPATIDIAAGQQTATFAVMALASGEALITLTAGTEVIQISLLVDRTLGLTGGGLATSVGVLVAPTEAPLAPAVGVQVR